MPTLNRDKIYDTKKVRKVFMTKIILFEPSVPDGFDKLLKKFGIDAFAKSRFNKELIAYLEGLEPLTDDDYDGYGLYSKCRNNPDTIFAFEYEVTEDVRSHCYVGWNSVIHNFTTFHIREYDETVKHHLFEYDGADILEPLHEPVCLDEEHNIWGFKLDTDPSYNPLG